MSVNVDQMITVSVMTGGCTETYRMEAKVARGLRTDLLNYLGVTRGTRIEGGAYPYWTEEDDAAELIIQFRLVETVEIHELLK